MAKVWTLVCDTGKGSDVFVHATEREAWEECGKQYCNATWEEEIFKGFIERGDYARLREWLNQEIDKSGTGDRFSVSVHDVELKEDPQVFYRFKLEGGEDQVFPASDVPSVHTLYTRWMKAESHSREESDLWEQIIEVASSLVEEEVKDVVCRP